MLLVRGNLDGVDNISQLEKAASELYKALQAGRDRGKISFQIIQYVLIRAISDMAATMERLGEYQTHNSQFCRRLLDYLSMKFNAEVITHILLCDQYLTVVGSSNS
jgi:exocyst complex component 1